MGLSEYRLSELLRDSTVSNRDLRYGVDMIQGVSQEGRFISPNRDTTELSLYRYKIVDNGAFVYNATSLDKGAIAYRTEGLCIVSHLCVVFYLNEKGKELVDPNYLFMFFRRKEFWRRIAFMNFGSQRAEFTFRDFSTITITLPPLSIQQKYVRIYNALRENLRVYERGLEDLKMVCDGFIEDLRRKIPCEKIGGYIVESVKKNDSGLSVDYVRGLATSKEIIETKADMTGVNLSTYKLLQPGQIAYVPDTSRRADKVSMGFNDTDNTFLVSSISIVFSTDSEKLLPEYLMLFLSRSEFDRYARFHSWGSARENFSFEDMCDVSIPIPDLATQESIANIYKVYQKRKSLSEKLKSLIKSICPVLIKGALEEAQKES